jgi:hypothetical protein
MSVVVDLPPPSKPELSATALRLRDAGRGLAPLLTVFLGLSVAAVAGTAIRMVFEGGESLKVGPALIALSADRSHLVMAHAPLIERLLYALLTVARAAPLLAVLWTLRDLFQRFGEGEVFGRATAGAVRAIGLWLLVDAAAGQAWQAILTGRLLVESPVQGLWEPAVGGVVIVVALAMQAGREIQEDHEGFI